MNPSPSDLVAPNPGALAAADAALLPGDVNPDVAALVSQWRTRLNQAYGHDKYARDRYDDDRRVARGDTAWLVDTNLVGAILEILESFVIAKEPDYNVTVSDSVNNTRGKKYKEVTETIRIVVSRLLRQAGMKAQGKRLVKSAQTVGAGWLKPSLITGKMKDPIVENQINSLRENLKRLEVLEGNLATGDVPDEGAAKQEILANITALEAKLERTVGKGVALDIVSPDDVQVAPECGELVNYLNAPWIRVRTYKSKIEAQEITGWTAEQMGQANIYTQRIRSCSEQNGSATGVNKQQDWIKVTDANAETADGFVCVEEVWSKRDGVVYTMIDGINDRWARKPYAPCTGARFYDVFLLGFHFIDGERHPQSDVYQLKKLQDEYGRTRSNFAEHRKRSIPITVWDAAEIPPDELKKITSAEALDHVAVQFTGSTNNNMQNRFFRFAGAPIDPAMYTTQPITTDMEKVSGAQDAMQSGVAVEKTATEAQIQNTGFGARISTRRDALESLLAEVGLYVAQLALLYLPEEEVIKIAGEDAVWPRLTVDEVMNAFDIEVKAGSTGKPNQAADRAAWSTLLPLVEKMITVIGNFRAQGPQMEWAARPYIEMLTTTFELLGNKDDVERYLPHPPPQAPVDPVAALIGAVTGGEGGEPGAAPGPMESVLSNIGTPSSTPAPATPNV